MKRDMDMIRDMMMELGNASGPISSEQLLSECEDRGLVHYHAWLIHDAGLVQGTVAECIDGSGVVFIRRLTWQGQDFLAAASNESTWSEARRRIKAVAGDVSLQVLVRVLGEVALQSLGLRA